MTQPIRSSERKPFTMALIGGILLAIGIIGMVVGIRMATGGVVDTVDKTEWDDTLGHQLGVPEQLTLQFAPGTYVVSIDGGYNEWPGTSEQPDPAPRRLEPPEITVTTVEGRPIRVRTTGLQWYGFAEFTIQQEGRYTVDIGPADPEISSVSITPKISLNPEGVNGILNGIVVGVISGLLFILGIVLLVIGLVRRSSGSGRPPGTQGWTPPQSGWVPPPGY